MSQCTAHRKNGDQCKAPAIRGASVCRIHGGMAPQVRRRAAQRLLEASDSAAALLVKIVDDEKVPTDLRLRAARDPLDRAGLSGKERIEVEVIPPEPAPWERLVAQVVRYEDTDADGDRMSTRIEYTPGPAAELEMRATPVAARAGGQLGPRRVRPSVRLARGSRHLQGQPQHSGPDAAG